MPDLSLSHLVVIAVVGILVLGPDKLPGFVRDAVRVWRTVRGLATDAQLKITGELLPDVPEEVRAMPPRRLAAHLLLDGGTDSTSTQPATRG